MACLTYGVDQSQSQSRGTFFLAALIKAFEDAFIVKRMFACIADFEGGRGKGDGYLATFVGMYEGVFQQVGYQHRCQRLAHRYAESGGFGHFYPDVAVGVYLLIIVEVGAEYLVQADFFLVGELGKARGRGRGSHVALLHMRHQRNAGACGTRRAGKDNRAALAPVG